MQIAAFSKVLSIIFSYEYMRRLQPNGNILTGSLQNESLLILVIRLYFCSSRTFTEIIAECFSLEYHACKSKAVFMFVSSSDVAITI